MNILKSMNTINSIGKYLLLTILVLNFVSLSIATDASTNIKTAMSSLCTTVQAFLGIAAMMLIVLAGVVYAAGQVLGAETRARASVWATAMLTGAVIGILIYLLVPPVIKALVAGTGASGTGTDTSQPCSF
jgi:hypothetical protein